MEALVKKHYQTQNLARKIQEALEQAGKNILSLAPRDLAAVDQLHTGGAPATLSLMGKAGLAKEARVLDVGCGLGGSSRLLAKTFGFRVTAIDLAPAFIETAELLTRWCRLDPSIDYHQGSVLDLPFEDHAFDGILCQHILMNIPDKKTALTEFFRVLKPGGTLILHEIFQGTGKTLALPVPWAASPSISFLEPWTTFEPWLAAAGFTPDSMADTTQEALSWWQRVHAANQNTPPRPLGPHLVFGKNAAAFGSTMSKNFQNNTLQCIEAVFKKS